MMRALADLLLAALSAVAAERRWQCAASANFELYTTASEKKAREAVIRLEQVRSFFLETTGLKPPSRGPVRVVAFNSAAEYAPYRMGPGAAAFAGGAPGRDDIVIESLSEDTWPQAVHEYVHLLFKPYPKLPLWFNEGQAEVYSTLRFSGAKAEVGEAPQGRLLFLRTNPWITLATLFAVDRGSPYYTGESGQQVFYAESWALAHMLLFADGYRPHAARFLRLAEAGVGEGEAFASAYSKSIAQVRSDLDAYVHSDRIQPLVYDLAALKTADPTIHAANPLDVGLVLAGVFEDIQKDDEAREAYQRLQQQYAADPRIPEALGYLQWRLKREDEARAEFAKAAALGSRSPHLYYDYASLLDAAGAPPEKQIPLLRRAIELDPQFREARYDLAMLLVAEEEFEDAEAQFAAIPRVEPPEAFRFYRAMAYARYDAGDTDAARATAQRAAAVAPDAAGKASAETLLATIETPPPAVHEHKKLIERPYATLQGDLEQIDCQPGAVRILLTGGRGPLWLLLSGGAGSLTCGPQKPRPVRVQYVPARSEEHGTAGVVHSIEFR
jgi:tetratricopeptide (TPR) repeat protein